MPQLPTEELQMFIGLMALLLRQIHTSAEIISRQIGGVYVNRGFMSDNPDGKLNTQSFMKIYSTCFPTGNATEFCDHVFRFDQGKGSFEKKTRPKAYRCGRFVAWYPISLLTR